MAICEAIRVSPQIEPGCDQDPRSGLRKRLSQSDVLTVGELLRDVKKFWNRAIANAENNHQLDVDRLYVSRSHVVGALCMKRFARVLVVRLGSIRNLLVILHCSCVSARRPIMGQKVNPIGFVLASTGPGILAGTRKRSMATAARRYSASANSCDRLSQAGVLRVIIERPAKESTCHDSYGASRVL